MGLSDRFIVRNDTKGFVLLDHPRERVFAADPEGRLTLVHTPMASYKRSRYDTWYRVVTNPWPGLDVLVPEELRDRLLPDWVEVWMQALSQVSHDSKSRESAVFILQSWIERFIEFHAADATRFSALLDRIPILPPDAYQSLYLRVQQGCPWNRCAFCSFFKDTPYNIPRISDMEAHALAVRGYWGRALRSRHCIFLGDANAVAIPAPLLAERMDVITRLFPEPELREIHSFVDFFAGSHRSVEELRALRQRGLVRITLGIESGHAPLMEKIEKPLDKDALLRLINACKEAGISLNLIFLIGLGGRSRRAAHRSDSLDLIARSTLGKGHRVYLSPIIIDTEQPYEALADREGWEALSESEMKAEIREWAAAIRKNSQAQISPYHIRRFVY